MAALQTEGSPPVCEAGCHPQRCPLQPGIRPRACGAVGRTWLESFQKVGADGLGVWGWGGLLLGRVCVGEEGGVAAVAVAVYSGETGRW
jgi:hypothetical protein